MTDFGPATFDFDGAGNGFTPAGATPSDPVCVNCSNADANVELYLWRLKSALDPPNSFRQLTFTVGGALAANRFPDINQKGTFVGWDSDRDHTPGSPGNADANHEIFLMQLTTGAITQVTNSTGGGSDANRSVSLNDDARFLVFDSTRNYNGIGCTLTDGVTACDNSDGNSEVMFWDRVANTLTQITRTTDGSTDANVRPRISTDGRFIAFQSTRDFSGGVDPLPPGATCTLADGSSPCLNAGGDEPNGEIMLFDRLLNAYTQVTKTTATVPCTGNDPNERVEISRKGKFITWQSKCEAQLNPAPGCGSCDGNDEAFIFERKLGKITQLTISNTGFNRVPRVAGGGAWIVFESDRNYKTLNAAHNRTLYILKRNTTPGAPGESGLGQVIDDSFSPVTQNSATKLVTISFPGGFNTIVERFGASNTGRYFAFDNAQTADNQEIWRVDRKK